VAVEDKLQTKFLDETFALMKGKVPEIRDMPVDVVKG
jgi:hypothetical protein